MTSISATSGYSAYLYSNTSALLGATTSSGSDTSSSATSTPTSSAATSITLSDAAKAALSQVDFSTVITAARAALDALFKDGTKPANADLSGLDRRQLFAVASDADGKFTADEQAAAKAEQQRRLDAALAGPIAVACVTDDIESLYQAAIDYLDGAPTEEKATPTWTAQKEALLEAQKQLAADPSKAPSVDGDIVADAIQRAEDGTATVRSFDDVAKDARAALDSQIAAAKASGTSLVYSKDRKGQLVDFSKFDSRTLAAVALDQNSQFSVEEVSAARTEMHTRSSATLLAGLKSAGSDPASFAKNLISAYGSMSAEERAAAGWSDKLYAAAVASYNSASQIANLFGSADASSSSGDTTSAGNALSLLNSSDSASSDSTSGDGGMSLADYL